MLKSAKDSSKVLVSPLALSIVSGFAVYKFIVDGCKACAFDLVLALVVARLVWGALTLVRELVN